MASVKRFPGSPYWYACYKIPTGQRDGKGRIVFKRAQKSTGKEDRDEALQIAIAHEKGGKLAASGQWSDVAARRFITEIAAIAGRGAGQSEGTGAFLNRWLEGRRTTLAPAAFARYAGIVREFIAHLGPGEAAPVGGLDAAQVATFRDAELAKGKSPATVNKALMVIGQAFGEAERQRLVTSNPARGLAVRGGKSAKQHREPFTFEQFRALVVALSSPAGWRIELALRNDWRTFVLLAGYTGGRQQEIAQMEWPQVDLERGVLTLERSKTADTHWLPIHPALGRYLAETPPERRRGPIMPKLASRQRRHISNDFRRMILPRIGIDQDYAKKAKPTKGRTLAAYSIHSLRHSLSTWLGAAGVDEGNRMKLIGHSDEAVNRGYTHTSAVQLAAELAKVPDVTL